jgi:hypothetical protein
LSAADEVSPAAEKLLARLGEFAAIPITLPRDREAYPAAGKLIQRLEKLLIPLGSFADR